MNRFRIFFLFLVLLTISLFVVSAPPVNAQINQIIETIVGNADPGSSISLPPADQLDCNGGSNDVDEILRREFNFEIIRASISWPSWIVTSYFSRSDVYPSTPSCETKKNIYSMLRRFSAAPFFINKLKERGRISMHCFGVPGYGGNFGFVGDSSNIGYMNCQVISASNYFIFLHELGHVFHNRNDRILQAYPHRYLSQVTDRDCYDPSRSYVFKTYSLCSVNNELNESFAESLAIYFKNSASGCGKSIDFFKSKCVPTYNFMRDNVWKKEFR